MNIEYNNQISQTISITQLTKHHCDKLIPTCEMLHIFIDVILAKYPIELTTIQKYNK